MFPSLVRLSRPLLWSLALLLARPSFAQIPQEIAPDAVVPTEIGWVDHLAADGDLLAMASSQTGTLQILRRDETGSVREEARFLVPIPSPRTGRSLEVANGSVLLGNLDLRTVQVFRRDPDSGAWGQVQTIEPPAPDAAD